MWNNDQVLLSQSNSNLCQNYTHTSVCACEEEWFIDLQQSQKMLAIVKIENETTQTIIIMSALLKKIY